MIYNSSLIEMFHDSIPILLNIFSKIVNISISITKLPRLRFTSLQKRNMLEVRKKVMPHRKYKLKHVEKWRKKLPEEIDELVKMKRKKKKIKLSE